MRVNKKKPLKVNSKKINKNKQKEISINLYGRIIKIGPGNIPYYEGAPIEKILAEGLRISQSGIFSIEDDEKKQS